MRWGNARRAVTVARKGARLATTFSELVSWALLGLAGLAAIDDKALLGLAGLGAECTVH